MSVPLKYPKQPCNCFDISKKILHPRDCIYTVLTISYLIPALWCEKGSITHCRISQTNLMRNECRFLAVKCVAWPFYINGHLVQKTPMKI